MVCSLHLDVTAELVAPAVGTADQLSVAPDTPRVDVLVQVLVRHVG